MDENELVSETHSYLGDNKVKRTLGYCVVLILSFLLGCGISVQFNNIKLQQFVIPSNINLIFIGYVILSAVLFIAAYVSLYANKCASYGYKIIVGLECSMFIIMISLGLIYVLNSRFYVLLLVYGTINLSSMLFYFRLSGQQLEYVRYELVWPALHIIALSAYMGYILFEYITNQEIEITFFIPVLLILLYEYVLFLSNIPDQNAENDKVRIGLVHTLFLILFLVVSFPYNSCRSMMYFLMFSAVSAILEALDIIARKKRPYIKEKYESAISCAICSLLFLGSIAGILMVKIPLIQVLVLICFIEVYSIIFYNISEQNGYTVLRIDVTKMVSFIISILLVFLLIYVDNWGNNIISKIQIPIPIALDKAKILIFTTISTIVSLGIGCFKKEFRNWFSIVWADKAIWKHMNIKHLFVYLLFISLITAPIASIFIGEEFEYRARSIVAVLFILVVVNAISFWIVRKKKEFVNE